jgi:hypothetical protein
LLVTKLGFEIGALCMGCGLSSKFSNSIPLNLDYNSEIYFGVKSTDTCLRWNMLGERESSFRGGDIFLDFVNLFLELTPKTVTDLVVF